MTARQGSTITWASSNYPIDISAGSGATAETVSFSYGPDRQRSGQDYSGNSTYEATYYIGNLLELVATSTNNYRHYIYAGSEPVAVYSRNSSGTNTVNYLLSDHQASVASIVSSSGVQIVAESFDAFGNRRNPTTWSGPDTTQDLTTIAGITRQGYTFQTALGLWMGMNHMNGRVEDSVTGRMMSADPFIPDPTNTQSYNRFSYVDNNPLTYIDPSGFDGVQNCELNPPPPPVDSSGAPSNGGNATVVVTANPFSLFGCGLGEIAPFEGGYCGGDIRNCPDSQLEQQANGSPPGQRKRFSSRDRGGSGSGRFPALLT
jgi:RHS repeat-associated protein